MVRRSTKKKKLEQQAPLPGNWNEYGSKDKVIYKKYGFTKEELRLKLDNRKLSLRCDICNALPTTLQSKLYIDHIHVKNYKKLPANEKVKFVRGLLCFRCNKFLVGILDKYKNSREVLEGLQKYFTKYKTKFEVPE